MSAAPLESITGEGITLRFQDLGTGSPPLVFVHGWGCSHRHFAPQIQHFSVENRVVSPDQRGHGESDAPHEPIGVELLARDLV